MASRTPVVGGNWKMNLRVASATELAAAVRDGRRALGSRCEVVVYPAFPHLAPVAEALRGGSVSLGAQNVWPEPDGAYTGEVSTSMLTDLGVSVVLAGHSERRHVIGETDAVVNTKTRAALAAGLGVTVCVGETAEQRRSGSTEEINVEQTRRCLSGVSAADMARVVIAYEPVWAIGTGDTASPDDAEAVHAVIRATIAELYDEATARATRIQYGGSVKPGNAAELIARDNIDGFLVGGASLKAADFLAILQAAADAA